MSRLQETVSDLADDLAKAVYHARVFSREALRCSAALREAYLADTDGREFHDLCTDLFDEMLNADDTSEILMEVVTQLEVFMSAAEAKQQLAAHKIYSTQPAGNPEIAEKK